MNTTHTGIAVAVALAVVVFFFVSPGALSFKKTRGDAAANVSFTTQPTTFMTTENPTTLQMTDTVPGKGAEARPGDTVTVHYVGSLTNGTVFDASLKHGTEGFTFNLGAGQVIRGWDEGLVGMKEGGKRLLVIPAHMAYGDREIPGLIPANSTLVFEVELLKVQKQ